MRDACGLDCRGDGVCAAVVVYAHVARIEVRRKEDVDALRAAEGTLERGPPPRYRRLRHPHPLRPTSSCWRRRATRRGPSSSAEAMFRRRSCLYSPKHQARRTLRASSALRDSEVSVGGFELRGYHV